MRRTINIRLLVEASAWGVGGALLIAYAIAQLQFARWHDSGLQEFAAARMEAQQRSPSGTPLDGPSVASPAQEPQSEPEALLLHGAPNMSSWSASRIAAYQAEDVSSLPEAVLRIPSIDLEVLIYAGVTESNLNRGAAWIEETAPLGSRGNAGVASHRDGYFRSLRDIGIGDRIELQTLLATHVYFVAEISVVPPTAVEVLAPTDDESITLVTCYPFYVVGPAPKRFVVQARAARAAEAS